MSVDLLGPASDQAVTVRPGRTIVRGVNDTWFKDCTDPNNEDGTAYGADFFNDMLAQVRTALRTSGITLDGGDDMLWRAMQAIGLRIGADTGAANALVVNFAPNPVVSTADGLPLLIKVAHDNTSTCTLQSNGTTALALTWPDGTPMQAGDLRAGGYIFVISDGIKYQLLARGSAAQAIGSFVRRWVTQTSTYTAITTVFSPNNTPMAITDGVQVLSMAVTPKSTASVFDLTFTAPFQSNDTNGSNYVYAGIFRSDGTCVAAGEWFAGVLGAVLTVSGRDAPATAAPVTYSVRVGVNGYTGIIVGMNGRPAVVGDGGNGHAVSGMVAQLSANEIRGS